MALELTDSEVKGGDLVKRHRISTRLWHWINAIAVIVMLMSGLTISNAHPHLYWGEFGANFDHAWFNPPHFPAWATIPSGYNLALARTWHLAFAWVLAFGLLLYLIASLITRHIQRDLTLTTAEIRPSHIWADIKNHVRLRFPTGAAALRYNILQKLTYIVVIFVLIPLLIVTGLGLSPGFNAILPIPDLFGGRATVRSVHFICAGGIALFIVVHLLLVLLAGPYNEIRSMVTGRYRIPSDNMAQSGDAA